MTKSTITDERITSVIERMEHFASNLKWTDVRGAQDLLTAADGLRELQERRKADREPVGYFGRFDPDDEDLIDQCSKNVKGAFPLYRHAQPAPVVPDERPSLNNGIVGFDEGWNACRAAMLQAGDAVRDLSTPVDPQVAEYEQNVMQADNSPVIPDTWIPVSERMPEDEQEVLTSNRMGHRFVSFFDKHSGLFFDRLDAPAACCIEHVLVTHWMPLPAAPQEVSHD